MIFAGLLIAYAVYLLQTSSAAQYDEVFLHKETYYTLFAKTLANANDARAECLQNFGDLANVKDQVLYSKLQDIIKTKYSGGKWPWDEVFYIGLTATPTGAATFSYAWSDSTPLSLTQLSNIVDIQKTAGTCLGFSTNMATKDPSSPTDPLAGKWIHTSCDTPGKVICQHVNYYLSDITASPSSYGVDLNKDEWFYCNATVLSLPTKPVPGQLMNESIRPLLVWEYNGHELMPWHYVVQMFEGVFDEPIFSAFLKVIDTSMCPGTLSCVIKLFDGLWIKRHTWNITEYKGKGACNNFVNGEFFSSASSGYDVEEEGGRSVVLIVFTYIIAAIIFVVSGVVWWKFYVAFIIALPIKQKSGVEAQK